MYTKLKTISFLLALVFISSASFAQGQASKGKRGKMSFFASLSDKQKEDMKKLRLPHQQDMLAYGNQLGELRAKLRTLETAEKPDMSAINGTIDKMSSIQAEMRKKSAAHKQDLRKILTPEQRLAFDKFSSKKGKKMKRHAKKRSGKKKHDHQMKRKNKKGDRSKIEDK